MRTDRPSIVPQSPRRAPRAGAHASWLLLLALSWHAGCLPNQRLTATPPADHSPSPSATSRTTPATSSPARTDLASPSATPPAAGFKLSRTAQETRIETSRPRLQHQVAVLHICIPHEHLSELNAVWALLREDELDADTRFRLEQNGLRVGVGHGRFWESIKTALEAIEGHWVACNTPVSVPVGFPLALELNPTPRDVTLFYLGADGVLSGNTWPACRPVFRLDYWPDPQSAERIVLRVLPELHQEQQGWEYIRTDEGFWRSPKQYRATFGDAGFRVNLAPGEFVLLAPSAAADVDGLLGREFLLRTQPQRADVSLIFLHPRVQMVGEQ